MGVGSPLVQRSQCGGGIRGVSPTTSPKGHPHQPPDFPQPSLPIFGSIAVPEITIDDAFPLIYCLVVIPVFSRLLEKFLGIDRGFLRRSSGAGLRIGWAGCRAGGGSWCLGAQLLGPLQGELVFFSHPLTEPPLAGAVKRAVEAGSGWITMWESQRLGQVLCVPPTISLRGLGQASELSRPSPHIRASNRRDPALLLPRPA